MILKINKRHLVDFSTPKVMGILNCTPDSFYATSRLQTADTIAVAVDKMYSQGVDILDIGASSTRPGAPQSTHLEELKRLKKVMKTVVKHAGHIPIAIDTIHKVVAEYAIDNGASIVNDISAGNDDSSMLPWIAEKKIPYVMMHKKGIPENMQKKTNYSHILTDILNFFKYKLSILERFGHHDIIIDVGFGFAKTLEQNYYLLKNLECFKSLKLPLLTGISRKSMVYNLLDIQAKDALNGTSVLHLLALQNGANILRVHDVKEAKQTIKLFEYYKQVNKK